MTKTLSDWLDKFRYFTTDPMLWGYTTRIRYRLNRAKKILGLSMLILDAQIRIAWNLLIFSEDEDIDKQIFRVLNGYLLRKEVLNDEQEREKTYRDWLDKNPCAEAIREKFLQSEQWALSLIPDEQGRTSNNSIVDRYRSLTGKEITPFNSTQITAHIKQLKKDNKKIQIQFREGKARKIEFSLPSLYPVLPIASVFFTASGYIYSTIYYEHFGIDVSLFFSLSDYLAASIEKIEAALWATAGFIFGALRGYVQEPAMSRLELQRKYSQRTIFIALPVFLGAILSFLVAPFYFYELYFPLAAILIAIFLWENYSGKYLKNPDKDGKVFVPIFIFVICLWGSANGAIVRIESGEQPPFRVKTSNAIYDESNGRLIGGNSQFIFLLDHASKEKKVLALPKSSIKSLRVAKEPPNWIAQSLQGLREQTRHFLRISESKLSEK